MRRRRTRKGKASSRPLSPCCLVPLTKDISRALVRLTDLFASKDSYTREQPLATDPLVSIVINKLEISFSHLKYCDISQGTTLSVPRFRNTEKARDGLTVVQATI